MNESKRKIYRDAMECHAYSRAFELAIKQNRLDLARRVITFMEDELETERYSLERQNEQQMTAINSGLESSIKDCSSENRVYFLLEDIPRYEEILKEARKRRTAQKLKGGQE